MVKRDQGPDTGGEQVVDVAAVMIEAGLVHGADAVREDARPRQRETVGIEARLAHQRDIGERLRAIVGVDGDVGVVLPADDGLGNAVAVGVDVPLGKAAAVVAGVAFHLEGAGGGAPKEFAGGLRVRHRVLRSCGARP